MTWLILYSLLKFWLPVMTALGLLVKGVMSIRRFFVSLKDDFSTWADQLLNNHFKHIEESIHEASVSVKSMATTTKELSSEMLRIREDLAEHQRKDDDIQGKILTDLEVMKAIQQARPLNGKSTL